MSWTDEKVLEKKRKEPLRKYSNPLIALEIHIPQDHGHIGLGVDWVDKIEDKPDELSLEMVAKCQDMFTYFDKDRDRLLAVNDLGPLIRSMGQTYNPSEKELQDLRDRFLPPGAETFDFKDFLRMIGKAPREQGDKEALIEAFRAFDTAGIGVISADQLRTAMLNLGEGMTEEQVQEMLLSVEIDKRGEIDYNELIKLMLSE